MMDELKELGEVLEQLGEVLGFLGALLPFIVGLIVTYIVEFKLYRKFDFLWDKEKK